MPRCFWCFSATRAGSSGSARCAAIPQDNGALEGFFNATVDAALALQTCILAAETLGLGTCPISVLRNRSRRSSAILELPDKVFPVAGLCLGYPAQPGFISMRLPLAATVHIDRYDDRGAGGSGRRAMTGAATLAIRSRTGSATPPALAPPRFTAGRTTRRARRQAPRAPASRLICKRTGSALRNRRRLSPRRCRDGGKRPTVGHLSRRLAFSDARLATPADLGRERAWQNWQNSTQSSSTEIELEAPSPYETFELRTIFKASWYCSPPRGLLCGGRDHSADHPRLCAQPVFQPVLRFLCGLHVPRVLAALFIVLSRDQPVCGRRSVLSGPIADWIPSCRKPCPSSSSGSLPLSTPLNRCSEPCRTSRISARRRGGGGQQQPGRGAAEQRPAERLADPVARVVASGAFTTMLVLFFVLMAGDRFLRRLVEILPRFQTSGRRSNIAADRTRHFGLSRTITMMNALVGLATGLMAGCGLGDPLLWGTVAFLLNYVPMLGPDRRGFAVPGGRAGDARHVMDGAFAAGALPADPCLRGRNDDADAVGRPVYGEPGAGHASRDLLVLDVGRVPARSCRPRYWRSPRSSATGSRPETARPLYRSATILGRMPDRAES